MNEDTGGAPPEQPSGPPAGESSDDIINEIAAEAQAARLKQLEARQPAKPEPKEPPAETKAEADDDDDTDEPEPAPAKKPAAKADEADGDFADVDALSAEERLEQAAAALAKGDLKKALRLTLKTKPEALNVDPGKFAALRLAQQRERAKTAAQAAAKDAEFAQREQAHTEKETLIAERERNFKLEVNQWIERLKPYEVYHNIAQAFQNDGDPKHLVQLIEGLTGKKYNDAQALILRSEKQDPRLSRMQNELEQMRRERAEERRQNEERRQADERRRAEEEQRQSQASLAQARENDIAHIRKQLKGHEVAKLPRFEERVYKVLEKHYDPKLGGLKMTVEQAAARVLRAERKRVESSPFYVKPTPAVETPAKLPAARTPLRRESQNNGAAVGSETDDEIIADIAAQAQRARMAAGRGTNR